MKHFSENLVFFCGLPFMKVFTINKCTINFVHRRELTIQPFKKSSDIDHIRLII